MALTSTIYNASVELSDVDRGVYESFELKLAIHPSESAGYLATRLLAYCCEYAPGIEFSRGGLSDPDDPPIAIRDRTGAMQAWIDIGTPAADRLHRASKATPRVAVYVHREASQWLEGLAPHDPARYRHNRTGEDNADAHLKRQVMGREVVVAVTAGQLDFGPWEQIFYGEFDGRRPKRVLVKVIGE